MRESPPRGQPFIWLTLDMLVSPAYRALSGGGRRVVDRILIEHMAHGGGRNGALAVTYTNFQDYGIRRRSILHFLIEASVLGFVARTEEGRTVWGDFEGVPARYRLTWLPTLDGLPATHEWRRHSSVEEARKCLERALSELKLARVRRKVARQSNEATLHGAALCST